MRKLPILFNTEMVRAILDGRKTQTRRVIKPQPTNPRWNNVGWLGWDDGHGYRMKAPCAVGDVLWVRETWCKGRVEYGEEPDGRNIPYIEQCTGDDCIIQKEWAVRHDVGIEDVVWKPSIHMPREAARIFLRVKNVRLERLQQITEEEALAEGVPDDGDYPINSIYCQKCRGEGTHDAVHPESLGHMEVDCKECNTPTKRFAHLWDSIVKPVDFEKYGWCANPCVWVIEFNIEYIEGRKWVEAP